MKKKCLFVYYSRILSVLFLALSSLFVIDISAMEPRASSSSKGKERVLDVGQRPAPFFVANIPTYVPADESDGEESDVDEEIAKKYTFEDYEFEEFPFKIDTEKRGKFFETPIALPVQKSKKSEASKDDKSSIVQKILLNLETTGSKLPEDISARLYANFCLNRPKSMSSKKNACLFRELEKTTDNTNIQHRVYGQFWTPVWEREDKVHADQRRRGNSPRPLEVLSYYHQLKQRDKQKAREFRKLNEDKLKVTETVRRMVPYCSLRENLKNSDLTKKLVESARKSNPRADVYLFCCDKDTISFNGCFDTFSEIVQNRDSKIAAMTTGYLYDVSECKDVSKRNLYDNLKFASVLDMRVRAATAKYFSLGVYYPEPVLAIRVPERYSTVPERFENGKSDYKSPMESSIILKQVKMRGNSFSFVYQNPLVTTVPERATKQKAINGSGTHNDLKFDAFLDRDNKFIGWSIDDIKSIRKNVAQSHANGRDWATNLLNAFDVYNTDDAKKVKKDKKGPTQMQITIGADTAVINKSIGTVTRGMVISLLSRLFKCYDPISLAGESKVYLVYILKNYEANGGDRIDIHVPEEARTICRDVWSKVDNITSKRVLKQVLSQLLKNCDVEKIDRAAKETGKVIRDTLFENLNLNG